jgi:hypothetical protein
MADPCEWEVEVTYAPFNWGQTGKWNIEVSSDGIESVEATTFYNDGSPIINSYHDLYPGGIPKTYYDEKFTISFTTDSVEADALSQLRGKICSTAQTLTVNGLTRVFAAYTLKMGVVQWKTTYKSIDASYHQFSVNIDLLYRSVKVNSDGLPDPSGTEIGWATHIDDKGYNYFLDSSPLLNQFGENYATSPTLVNLDGHGYALNLSSNGTDAGALSVFYPSTPKYVDYTADFTSALSGITGD